GCSICRICQGTGHWSYNCPNRNTRAVPTRPSGPQVAAHPVVEELPEEQADPEDQPLHEGELDLGEYRQEPEESQGNQGNKHGEMQ
ncbi:hypothetical protein EQG41_21210, partial [Billgrantia azerbaijanica]